jgi:hypothetical protein
MSPHIVEVLKAVAIAVASAVIRIATNPKDKKPPYG